MYNTMIVYYDSRMPYGYSQLYWLYQSNYKYYDSNNIIFYVKEKVEAHTERV